jgi:hypothetical protein
MEQVQTVFCNSESENLGKRHICIYRRLFAYNWPEKWAGAARWRYRMFPSFGHGSDCNIDVLPQSDGQEENLTFENKAARGVSEKWNRLPEIAGFGCRPS